MASGRLKNISNREQRWIYASNGSALQPVHADGVTPGYPHAEAGGVHVVKFDVAVPNVAAGNAADWHDSYPGSYTVGSHELDLLWYANPFNGAGKLNGKGNLWVSKGLVLIGAGCTGAAAPTMAGGQIEIIVRALGGSVNNWYYLNTMPTGTGPVTPNSRVEDFVIGTDQGVSPRLTLHINAITDPIVAGRMRFVFQVAEV